MKLALPLSDKTEVRFGPVRDRMTQLKSGAWVMHSFRAIIVNGRVIGTAEFHLQVKGEDDAGIITITRIRSKRDAL